MRDIRAWLPRDVTRALLIFGVAVAALAVRASGGGAHSHEMMAHRGAPSAIFRDQRVGPYVASVWTDPEVGSGPLYVVVEPATGVTFTQPSTVRVGIAPVSGRVPEVVREAHPMRVRRGARFMTDVVFDRAEPWNLRVVIDGSAGGGQLTSQVETVPNVSTGPFVLVLSLLPFLAVGGLWWRAAVIRRRAVALS